MKRETTVASNAGACPSGRRVFGLALGLGLWAASAITGWAGAPVHSVTGSGFVDEFGVPFRTTVTAFEDEAGQVWGEVVLNADLTLFDLGILKVSAKVNCLHVVGNSAWIGSVVTHSNNEGLVPVGSTLITMVRDLGGNGEDIKHTELGEEFPPCPDEPELPETVVQSGNFHVR